MYNVIWINGFQRAPIDNNDCPNKFGKPKLFKTRKSAEKWISEHPALDVNIRYEVVKAGEG